MTTGAFAAANGQLVERMMALRQEADDVGQETYFIAVDANGGGGGGGGGGNGNIGNGNNGNGNGP